MRKWLAIYFLTVLCSLSTQAQSKLCKQISDEGELRLKSQNLKDVEEYCSCENLKLLNLKKASIVKLPSCFLELPNLVKIDFSKTALRDFPDDISEGSNIQELDFSYTKLSALPSNLHVLRNLKKLNLRGTRITELPWGLEHLEKIDMRFIDLNKSQQQALREQYPDVPIYFSSPCNCG